MDKKGFVFTATAAIFFVILMAGVVALAAFVLSGTLRWILIGIAVMVGFVYVLGQAMTSQDFTTNKIVVLLIFLGVGLFFIFGSSFLQIQLGDNFVKPQWARLECAPTDSYEGVYIKWLDQESLFKCDANTAECRFTVEHTGSGIFVKSLRTKYSECDLNGNNCGFTNSLHLDDGEKKTLPRINVGRSYKFDVSCLLCIGENYGKVTQDWKPWKVYRFVGGAKFEQHSISCSIGSSDKGNILFEDRGITELSKTGGEGQKWINYVNDWVYGPASNIFDYNGEEVYCTAGAVYDIVELRVADGSIKKVDPTYTGTREDGTILRGLGNKISNVECCPNEPSCTDDFEYVKVDDTTQECFSNIQCFNAGGPVPVSGTSYVIYQCINDQCVKSAQISTECTTNAQCDQGQICDLSTTNYGQCITQTTGPYCGDNICQSDENIVLCPVDCKDLLTNVECNQKAIDQPLMGWTWVEEKTEVGIGPLGIGKLFGFTKEITTGECKAKLLPIWIISGMVFLIIILIFIVVISRRSPKRGKTSSSKSRRK